MLIIIISGSSLLTISVATWSGFGKLTSNNLENLKSLLYHVQGGIVHTLHACKHIPHTHTLPSWIRVELFSGHNTSFPSIHYTSLSIYTSLLSNTTNSSSLLRAILMYMCMYVHTHLLWIPTSECANASEMRLPLYHIQVTVIGSQFNILWGVHIF